MPTNRSLSSAGPIAPDLQGRQSIECQFVSMAQWYMTDVKFREDASMLEPTRSLFRLLLPYRGPTGRPGSHPSIFLREGGCGPGKSKTRPQTRSDAIAPLLHATVPCLEYLVVAAAMAGHCWTKRGERTDLPPLCLPLAHAPLYMWTLLKHA